MKAPRWPYREGEARAHRLLVEKATWQKDFYAGLPRTPTGRGRGAVDKARPDMTPAQEAARLRVSSRVIARANPRGW